MSMKSTVSAAEWERRVDLAAAFRLGERNWGDDLLFEHMTARSPDNPAHFLMNDPSLTFDEITASSLHMLDPEGKEVYRPDAVTHAFSYKMHKSVYDAIPEAQCVIHSHSNAAVAVSLQKHGLVRNTQWAIWIGPIAYHEYEGFLTGPHEAQKLVAAFSTSQVTLLRGHGLIVWGHSVREAYFLAHMVNRACAAQIASGTGPGAIEAYTVSEEIIARTQVEAQGTWSDKTPFTRGVWAATLRKAGRLFPGYDD